MAQPGLVRSLILIFMLVMTDFSNPLVIGRDIPVLAGILYDEMTGFQNTSLAAALAVWLILPALIVYVLIECIGRRKRYASAMGAPPELATPAPARLLLNTIVWGVVGALVAYAFDDLDLNKVYLQVFTTNEKGLKLWTKVGFKVEGVLRQHYFVNGAFHDMYSMSMLRAEAGHG